MKGAYANKETAYRAYQESGSRSGFRRNTNFQNLLVFEAEIS
ncbi:MAG: hypothetical protein Q8J64_06230 [Thermodesulfovibrionales bacterium]|nr:hypothetical protein [Thermodesulfovibrionales bacterium]